MTELMNRVYCWTATGVQPHQMASPDQPWLCRSFI